MRRMVHALLFTGLLAGGAVLAEEVASACVSYKQDPETGNCTCLTDKDKGYTSCIKAGRACVLTGSGCGDGPGIKPV
jgi:hypothetical protein